MYNLAGAIVYCVCQWVISAILVVHLSPDDASLRNTGLLQLSISITNIFYALSLYSVRTFQVSEVKNKYLNGDYIAARIITSSVAFLLCFIYALLFGYNTKEILCIMVYMAYKLTEAFCDVLHGINQKNYRMDYVGVSYIIRGVVSMVVFAITLLTTADIILSIVAMTISILFVVAFYDMRCTSSFGSVKPIFDKRRTISLLATCLPAVIASTTFIAITSIPRQTLEAICGEEALGYYGTMATPLVVVQVMTTSIFNPMLTELAEYYNEGNIKKFVMRLIKNLALLICISAIVCGCVAILGEFAVGIVFGENFVPYTYLMYGIVGCTTMYVISWLCTNTLIIMRKTMVCMIASLAALVVAVSLAKPFIDIFDMNGVSFSVIVAYVIHIAVCVAVLYKNLKRKEMGK